MQISNQKAGIRVNLGYSGVDGSVYENGTWRGMTWIEFNRLTVLHGGEIF
jgi:hypothetical protein